MLTLVETPIKIKLSCFRGGGWVVGGNEIKAAQPNLAWAWPELGNRLAVMTSHDTKFKSLFDILNYIRWLKTILDTKRQYLAILDKIGKYLENQSIN